MCVWGVADPEKGQVKTTREPEFWQEGEELWKQHGSFLAQMEVAKGSAKPPTAAGAAVAAMATQRCASAWRGYRKPPAPPGQASMDEKAATDDSRSAEVGPVAVSPAATSGGDAGASARS